MSNLPQSYILTVTCPARTGVVAAVTSFLADRVCYLPEMAQYDDETTGKFSVALCLDAIQKLLQS